MWRLTVRLGLCFLCLATSAAAGELKITTWNLEWFPNGSPRVAPANEQTRRIAEAARVIRQIDPDVLLLQEIQDYRTCERLIAAIGDKSYDIAVCSAFREATGALAAQQVAILSKAPAYAAWSEPWRRLGKVDPPRGFAFAWMKLGLLDVCIYCVHLKSNLVRTGNDREVQTNILKRELASEQLLQHLQAQTRETIPGLKTVLIGGDFNTNMDQEMFVSEKTLTALAEAGFTSCWEGVPLKSRITHPGRGRYPDATFDFVFSKGQRFRLQNPSRIPYRTTSLLL